MASSQSEQEMEPTKTMNAESFAECLLRDIFESFVRAMKVKIQLSDKREGKECMPKDFPFEIICFCQDYIDKLRTDFTRMPVLLFHSEQFFTRFTNSVCLKLVGNADDPQVGFLKVMAFLIVITAMSFMLKCYRSLDSMPIILRKLLEDHIQTKFYEEGRFKDILDTIEELHKNKKWHETTVVEIRTCMTDSLETELPPTSDPYEPDRSKIMLREAKSQAEVLCRDETRCPYCCGRCIAMLEEFWKPTIRYKPGFEPE